ncbi:MAG: phosphatidylserine decarboxylase family protein [Solitalea-like symbiont of Tyrophagus putrescentiae]
MRFHREGRRSLLVATVIGIIIAVIADKFFSNITTLQYASYIIAILTLLGVVYFFRTPSIQTVFDDTGIIASANGKIVQIVRILEPEYYKSERLLISIFMSPLDVHVNRNPISGIVKYLKYHPGKHLIAKYPKASTKNEHTSIVIENKKGHSVLFRQIAGIIARRIVYYPKQGDIVKQGEEMGFIKFGSRIDIFLPLDAKVLVRVNDKVSGGRTLIAKF